MDEARLIVYEAGGARAVDMARFPFCIGRSQDNELVLNHGDISRHHAKIVREDERYVLVDTDSRYGTFLNGETVTREHLAHGDQIQLGSTAAPALEFQVVAEEITSDQHRISRGGSASRRHDRATTAAPTRLAGAINMLGQALRAMVDGHVEEEVLAIVVDHAISLSGAERGFVMLANADGALDVRMARGRNKQTLPGPDYQTSTRVPQRVYRTAALYFENQVPEGTVTQAELRIRSILCAPLPGVRMAAGDTDIAAPPGEDPSPMGVLYVDSPGLGRLDSWELHDAFEQLAAEAAVAIQYAQLARDSEAAHKLNAQLALAAKIQRALLPPPTFSTKCIELAGTTIPCHAIGGDFYEHFELPDGRVGFALCDVAGKGPEAALLAAMIQGILRSSGRSLAGPSDALAHLNETLCRRPVERRFATIAFGVLDADGRLRLASAAHNPVYIVAADGRLRKLEQGGTMVGIWPDLTYAEDVLTLSPGDWLVLYSDGVTDAEESLGAPFEEHRLEQCLREHGATSAEDLVEHVVGSVHAFTRGYTQADDITVLVVRYLGSRAPAA